MVQSVWEVNVLKTANRHAHIQQEKQEEQQLANQQLTTDTDVKRRRFKLLNEQSLHNSAENQKSVCRTLKCHNDHTVKGELIYMTRAWDKAEKPDRVPARNRTHDLPPHLLPSTKFTIFIHLSMITFYIVTSGSHMIGNG